MWLRGALLTRNKRYRGRKEMKEKKEEKSRWFLRLVEHLRPNSNRRNLVDEMQRIGGGGQWSNSGLEVRRFWRWPDGTNPGRQAADPTSRGWRRRRVRMDEDADDPGARQIFNFILRWRVSPVEFLLFPRPFRRFRVRRFPARRFLPPRPPGFSVPDANLKKTFPAVAATFPSTVTRPGPSINFQLFKLDVLGNFAYRWTPLVFVQNFKTSFVYFRLILPFPLSASGRDPAVCFPSLLFLVILIPYIYHIFFCCCCFCSSWVHLLLFFILYFFHIFCVLLVLSIKY